MSEGPQGGGAPRGGWPVRLGEILEPALQRMGPRSVWTEVRLRKAWQQAVGREVAGHAAVRRLRGSSLEVAVDSDAWATELTYLSAAILERLAGEIGPGVVTEIVVQRKRRPRHG